MRWLAILFTVCLLTVNVRAADKQTHVRLACPVDAQALALADLQHVGGDDRKYTRYIWINDGKVESAQLANLTLNYVSRARQIARAKLVQQKPVMLVRFDIRQFTDSDQDVIDWLRLWEDFRFDPYFTTLITKDSIRILLKNGVVVPNVVEVGKQRILVKSEPYTVDGQQFIEKWVDVIDLPGRHLDDDVNGTLQLLTHSRAPVVDSRYFTFRSLSTIKDKGIYATVFGGLYYDLAGIRKNNTGKGTDEDLLFQDLGIGDVEKGVTAEVIFDRTKAEQRIALFRSKVTGKPRRIDFFPTLSARFGDGQGFLAVTHDIADQDIDIGTHPLFNLLNRFKDKNFKDKAREDIFRKANGLHGFALFNGDGKLQDSAPEDVVTDHLIPSPQTKRLQGAISCIRCHGWDGSDGLKPAVNDVDMLRKGYLNMFGDVQDRKKSLEESIKEAAGLYAGDHNPGMVTARRDYIKFILLATGPLKEDKDQTGIGKITANSYKSIFESWFYAPVDPKAAVAELGYEVEAADALKMLRTLLPPDAPDRKLLPGEIVLEDARLGALLSGIEITRSDWSLAYSFAASRARQTEAKMAKEKK